MLPSSAGSRRSSFIASIRAAGSRRDSAVHGCPSASRCSVVPDWVLLGTVAHMGRCRNSPTTAATETSGRCPIEVSFVLANPPSLTRCVVDCRHLTWGQFSKDPPLVIGADAAFLLISVVLPRHPDRSDFADLFVYSSGAAGAPPSLQLLPRPYPVGYLSNHIGVLSCGDHCLVVAPERQFDADDGRVTYLLHIFSSKTKSWSTKVARLADSGMKPHCGRFDPAKAIAVGGGSMAWVDLRNGILLFDSVPGNNPLVRLIQLPPLMPINVEKMGVGFFDGVLPCLDSVRDVTCSNGWFRFIEMGFPQLDYSSRRQRQLNFGWKATMFKMMIHSDKWEPCGTADSDELLPADSCLPDLFPGIWDSEAKKLTLNKVNSSFPTIDVYNNNVVYMMAKMKTTDPSGWVLALNTEKKKLERISSFSEESYYFHSIYRQSDFSNHINKGSG